MSSRAARNRRRLGWLLRANRILGVDPQLRTRAGFVRGLHTAVDPSKVSRWESGQIAAGHGVVQTYESLLGLPPRQLVAVFDHVLRADRSSVDPRPVLVRADDDDGRLDRLLEQVVSTAAVTGAEWDDLTDLLAARPGAFLPQPLWEELTYRLLMEMLVSAGWAWLQRYEAFNRLLAHPRSQKFAVAACTSAAANRANQAMMSTLAALGRSGHDDSNAALLAQLGDPTDRRALAGALIGLSEAVQLRGLPADRGRKTIRLLRPIALSDDPLSGLAAGVLDSITRPKAGPPPVSLRDERHWAVVQRVALSTAASVAHRRESFSDEVFVELLGELLFDADGETRLTAATLLAATPYRTGVAKALAEELKTRSTLAGDPEWTGTLLSALRMLGGDRERLLIERIVTAKGLPLETVETAAYAVGHMAPAPSTTWWSQAIEGQLRLHEPPPEILKGLAYSAGIINDHAVLHRLVGDSRTPYSVRQAATWWLSLPSSWDPRPHRHSSR